MRKSMESTNFLTTQAAAPSIPSVLAAAAHLTTYNNGSNSSSFSFISSAKDIAFHPLRFAVQLDRVVFRTFPRFVSRATGLQAAVDFVTDYWTGGAGAGAGAAAVAGDGGMNAMADAAGQAIMGEAAAEAVQRGWTAFLTEALHSSTFKSYWGMLHYVFSRWAFTCFVMALILNRINIYGTARQRIVLTWSRRLALRIIPMLLFVNQIRQLLQAIRCQTSPDFSLYRHGDNNKYSLLDWSYEGGPLHSLTSTMLWWMDDAGACAAVKMSRPEPNIRASHGSFSLLWPTFLRLCVSHLVESLSSSLQQMPLMTEIGMSVFEHSLAFAEAETMITHALGVGPFAASNKNSSSSSNSTSTAVPAKTSGTIPASGSILAIQDAINAITGPHLLDRFNIPVEVLTVALLSCCNALSSHIISIFGKQRQLRLINTGFWGLTFMASFVLGFFTTSSMVRSDATSAQPKPISGLLHFPTVAIIGFLPHMSILLGIFVCGCIYLTALLLTAVSLGTNPSIRQPTSLKERISIAHDNLQAAMQVKGLKLRLYEDFYTALLRLGFAALTAASEAVFLNEGRSVEMRQFTWLEEERLDEYEASRMGTTDIADYSHFQIAEEYGLPPSNPGGKDRGGSWQSGYSKERKFDPKQKDGQLQIDGTFVYPNPRPDGVGALQRTARFYLLFIFMRGIMFTIGGWVAFGFGTVLDRVGITARPNWLRRIAGKSLKQMSDEQKKARENTGTKMLDFWLITDDGKLALPKDEDTDIEPEMRKRVMIDHTDDIDDVLDERMYDWWKIGGWFGTKDTSGDYTWQTPNDEDDITSVISESIAGSSVDDGDDNGWESESDGQKTPTQASTTGWSFSHVQRQRSASPESITDTPLDPATLARLLNPPDHASKEEARILAAHLSGSSASPTIMTRSQYKRQLESERTQVLLAGRAPVHHIKTQPSGLEDVARPMTSAEEAEVLASLLLARRKSKKRQQPGGPNDDTTIPTGPPCVVCQDSPRTIIAWPCRCLCLCEDCRVSLAMNNFGNCVTCRRTVGGFVRLYVP